MFSNIWYFTALLIINLFNVMSSGPLLARPNPKPLDQ